MFCQTSLLSSEANTSVLYKLLTMMRAMLRFMKVIHQWYNLPNDRTFLCVTPWIPGNGNINIHGCYLLVNINFVPVCKCKNNLQIWYHNTSTSHLHDVTGQLWWRLNAKLEKAVLTYSGEMSDQLFSIRNKIIYSPLWIMIFWSQLKPFLNDFRPWLHHSWKSLMNCLTCNQKIIIHNKPYIILYTILLTLLHILLKHYDLNHFEET